MTTEPVQNRNKLLGVGIFAVATIAVVLYARAKPGKATMAQVYPIETSTTTSKGRVFQTINTPEEFDLLLSTPSASRGTLFATFVRLGESPSNSMATHMWEIVRNIDKPEYTSTVCVELAGGRNDQLVNKYMVNTVPSVVALKKTLPFDTYVDPDIRNSNTEINDVDKEKLRKWVIEVLQK
ncbi:hypothetical protein C6P40_000924 [Pichia californica]|uniref:Thioredoxin domain-containing protein n=1 Tax=Pichia californica TaxID=460514 RepID=A0A9P6WJR8_9ASCO|nr:hypothetical protein C6P40_000924 [[Candida] californica]